MTEPATTPPGTGGERCQGHPALCPHCAVELTADPAGLWCRTCRRSWQGSNRHAPCPFPPLATGATPRTRGLRLCRHHARLLIDRGGPHSVRLDNTRT